MILKLKSNNSIIKATLKYPDNHRFNVGKPDTEEKITKVIPVYAKLGPIFKDEGKKIAKWIQENQEKIIEKINKKGDIPISDIPVIKVDSKEKLLEKGYIEVQKETKVKGKKDSTILTFNGFYIEIQEK